MQFLGHGLRERRATVLAYLHFARENRHRSVFANMQPRADFRWTAPASTRPPATGFLRERGFGKEQHHDTAAEHFKKLATVHLETIQRSRMKFVTLHFNQPLAVIGSRRGSLCPTGRQWHPLPKGEGWGEGELRVRMISGRFMGTNREVCFRENLFPKVRGKHACMVPPLHFAPCFVALAASLIALTIRW